MQRNARTLHSHLEFVIIIIQPSYNNYMTDTTSILDLPTDPTGGGTINGGNVSFSASEKGPGQEPAPGGGGMALDQTTINQIVNGLQQASIAGVTQLQSRDIPQNASAITQDAQIQPNYIPPPQKEDYIQKYEDNETIAQNYEKKQTIVNTLDTTYEEIQMPLLVVVLYFLFQMPIVKRYMYKYMPGLFNKDGNSNLYGLLFLSITFGILYYILAKSIRNLL